MRLSRFACPAWFVAALTLASPNALAGALAFNTKTLNFGFVALTESKSKSAVLTNATSQAISLGSIVLSGTNAADFSYTTSCGKKLAAGASCDFSVTFTTPDSLSPRTAQLLVNTQDPAYPSLSLALKSNTYPALNDSGISLCGDAGQSGLACPVSGFPTQDAEVGRDKSKKNNADGHAGFSYTKLDAGGQPLPADATQWNCIRDNVTGLIWEVKPKGDGIPGNQGLHDADDGYSWYSSDNASNGGFAGYADQGNFCSGYDSTKASSFCNTEAYVQRVNGKGWCGAKNWRLPARAELLSLVDRSVAYPGPTIDKKYFPDTLRAWYWTSTPSASNTDYAWYTSFYNGYAHHYASRQNHFAVRLVRSGQ